MQSLYVWVVYFCYYKCINKLDNSETCDSEEIIFQSKNSIMFIFRQTIFVEYDQKEANMPFMMWNG